MEYTKGEWKVLVNKVTGGEFYSIVNDYRKHQFELAKIAPTQKQKPTPTS